jgi:hypothetical protein
LNLNRNYEPDDGVYHSEPLIHFCDTCKKPIPETNLYVVEGWRTRNDGFSTLSPVPKKVFCLSPCGLPEERKKEHAKRAKK